MTAPVPPPRPLLEARDLTMRFGGLIAVDGVSLMVERGTVTAVIGPNGAGKSTFFKLLSGELAPTSGDVYFEEERVTRLGVTRMCRRGIGKSYQVTQIFPHLTVLENVMIPALAARRGSFKLDVFAPIGSVAGLEALVAEAIDAVGLRDRVEMRAGDLSYGEKRRLEIGIALATQPKVLLLDEPAAGMSTSETAETVALIERLRSRVTIVIVEHDMDVVFGVADRIMVLQDGKTIAYGTPEDIRADPRVREAYLGGIEDPQ